ncbi:sulfatase-like hydrolase/transferase [Carboxylicivirga marina]|uniref:Sulfatase-like hydrolase/transferase n=1 Tax=Carboxylicivirga marina TaxID=2800988 RepID=A0ABS1HMP5_9BACT|nr:sulfatase-like hydrolase/transferase [Carboxylicivirga marina]MBK3518896.1 sulfatase-like hydrolase/transferase [Carboxylicivirga marina]
MNKFIYTICTIFILGLCSCNQDKNTVTEESRPNIIVILVDDLGKEWISHYGAEDISTPNIDALAESGVSFNNVYSMPQCTPTRVTILTGQYPFRHGWVNHWDVPRWGGKAHFDETMNPSLGIEMKKAGYSTCIAGKWQIDDFRVEPDALTKNGFDEFCMWTGYETGIEESAERYQDPYIYTKEGSRTYNGEFGPDIFKDFVIGFINNNKENPMFIYYPMVLTHTPFVNTPLDSASTNLGKHKAMVKYTDLVTGEIIQTLEDAGIRENTVIIWTTDNGTSRAITGRRNGVKVRGGKAKTTEPGISAPFIVSWPGKIDSNRISDALIDFSDFFPTCLDLAGVEPKEEWLVGGKLLKIDGYSFKDVLLKGKDDSHRKWILGMGGGNNAHLTKNGVENQYLFRDRVLRNERYKLYINSKREPVNFFDLLSDYEESNNLLDSLNTEERKSNFNQLYEVVQTFPKKDNDPKYNPNPSQTWDVKVTRESQLWKK